MSDQPRQTNRRKDFQFASALLDMGIEDRDLRIEIFTTCEGATEHNGRLSLVGTYEMLGAPNFPFVLPQVTVVLRLRFWPAESARHSVCLIMTNPDGKAVGRPMEAEATLRPVRGDRAEAYTLIAQLHNLPIEEPGEYSFDFYLDGRIEGRLPVCIFASEALPADFQ